MENQQRLGIFSTGGGGGNIARKVGIRLYEMGLGDVVGYNIIDTNKYAVRKTISLFPEEIRDKVKYKVIGPGNGSGCDPSASRRYIEDENTRKELMEMIEKDIFEAAPLFGALGKGTATGTILRLLQMLRSAGKMAFGVIVRCSMEYGEVEEMQDNAAEDTLKELDETGLPYILGLNRAVYIESEKNGGEKMTREKAYQIIDDEISNSLRPFMRLLANPDQADREDIRKLIYAGGNKGRKRWRLGTERLKKNFTEVELIEATHKCFENQCFDFDNSRIGGTLVIREGEFAAHEVAAMNLEMRSIVNGWDRCDDKREVTNPHYRLIEAEYPSIDENYVDVTFLFSEYNGDPDLENLPEIRWVDEESDAKKEIPGNSLPSKTVAQPQSLFTQNKEATKFTNLAAFVAALNLNNEAAREILGSGPEGLEFFTPAEILKNLDNPLFLKAMGGPLAPWYDRVIKILLEEKLQPIDGLFGPSGSENGFEKNPVYELDQALNRKRRSEEERKTILILKFIFLLTPLDEREGTLARIHWIEAESKKSWGHRPSFLSKQLASQ